MLSGTTLLYFLGASVALSLAPGPDNLFVLTQGITCGRRSAILTALGMASGVSVHTLAAAFGVSALFYSSALLFNAVKFAGAAYLLYLAYRSLRSPSSVLLGKGVDLPAAALFRRGFLMNVMNPKVALFFLAFLPQFVTPTAGAVPLQMLLLGSLFMLQAMLLFCLLGYFSGGIGNRLLSRPGLAKYFDWLTAGIFASLGIRLAFTTR